MKFPSQGFKVLADRPIFAGYAKAETKATNLDEPKAADFRSADIEHWLGSQGVWRSRRFRRPNVAKPNEFCNTYFATFRTFLRVVKRRVNSATWL